MQMCEQHQSLSLAQGSETFGSDLGFEPQVLINILLTVLGWLPGG